MLITIGAFDGFHKGHAELLRICRENADGSNWAVVTFHPHPSEFLGTHLSLFTLEEKEFIRRLLNIPNMFVLKFDAELMRMTPKTFWRLLRERLNVDGLVMGSDFRFGHGRAGNAESLREMAISDGVNRVIIADVIRKPEYSSSNVRENITAGKIQEAAKILGYPFFMISRIIHGNERGRTIHFPTANLDIEGRVIPAYGVYSSAVLVNDSWHCGALSIGNNPTFGDINGTRAEVHILDFDGDIYGEKLLTVILNRVRDIHTFNNESALANQIGHDINECRKIFGEVMNVEGTKIFMKRAREIYSLHDEFTLNTINLNIETEK